MNNPGGVDFQLHVKIEGHPSGVGLVLLPPTPDGTGATGRPALKAGDPGYCPYHDEQTSKKSQVETPNFSLKLYIID
jgi:hypothetical protein